MQQGRGNAAASVHEKIFAGSASQTLRAVVLNLVAAPRRSNANIRFAHIGIGMSAPGADIEMLCVAVRSTLPFTRS